MRAISICVPVLGTEVYLERCLKSISSQSFTDYEVIVVNDNSKGVNDRGLSCKKIVKEFSKSHKIKIKYIEHKTTKGLLEARRTALNNAKGSYIFNLNSDDTIPPSSLENLYEYVTRYEADVIEGNTAVVIEGDREEDKARAKELQKEFMNYERLSSLRIPKSEIFHNFLINKTTNSFVTSCLIRREFYEEVFYHLPEDYCVYKEDFFESFWINTLASSYVKVRDYVYNYHLNKTMDKDKKINTIEEWKENVLNPSFWQNFYCFVQGSVITFSEEENKALYNFLKSFLDDNLYLYYTKMGDEIKEEAYKLLCEIWTKEQIKESEERLKEKGLI